MTPTPFLDLAEQLRRAAVKGTRCHLDIDIARATASNPRIMALLAELAAEETAKLCLAAQPTPDSPPLPLFLDGAPLPFPTPVAAPPPGAPASGPPAKNCGLNGEPSDRNMPSHGMIEPLVPAAASRLASAQARETILRAARMKRSRHTLPPAPAPRPRSQPPRLVSQPS